VTRHSHPSYITTIALFHTCKSTIEVLNEVRTQEDEYEVLKKLERRIDGLSDHNHQWRLASRERRLIAQGLLKLVIPVDDDGQTSRLLTITPKLEGSRTPGGFKSSGDLWDSSGSVSSVASSTSEWPQTDATTIPGSTQYTNHPSPRRRALSHSRAESEHHDTKEVSVYVFVFADLVLFTLPHRRTPTRPDEGLSLMRGIGVSKILNTNDISGMNRMLFFIIEKAKLTHIQYRTRTSY
jgi:hypothetical protein